MATETATQAAAVSAAPVTLLDRILTEGKLARDEIQRAYARDLVGEFVNEVLAEGSSTIVQRCGDQDQRSDRARSTTCSARSSTRSCTTPSSRRSKATWRGLHYLVHQDRDWHALKIRVLNVTKKRAAQGPREGRRVRPERPVQEDLRGRVRHASAATLTACWSATTSSAGTRRTSAC